MALFGLWGDKKQAGGGKKHGKELARLEKLVGNKMSQNYDRQDAITTLSGLATAESTAILLKRFDWSMDPSITDQEEKEAAKRGIVAASSAAIVPIRTYCARAESLTWPLRVLQEIVPDNELTEELLGLLDQFDTEYVRNPEPKIQLIQELDARASEEVRVAVEPFLEDMNESVRFAAVATVFAASNEESVPVLVSALCDEESLRVKNRIALGLVAHGWKLQASLHDACRVALPPGYSLSDAGVLSAQ